MTLPKQQRDPNRPYKYYTKAAVDREICFMMGWPVSRTSLTTHMFLYTCMKAIATDGVLELPGFGRFTLVQYTGKCPELDDPKKSKSGVVKNEIRFKKSRAFCRVLADEMSNEDPYLKLFWPEMAAKFNFF